MLAVIWWMYGGYAWLTNHVRSTERGGAPRCSAGWPRSSSSRCRSRRVRRPGRLVRRRLPRRDPRPRRPVPAGVGRRAGRRCWACSAYNIAAAALVLAGGIVGGTAQDVLWAAAVVRHLGPVADVSSSRRSRSAPAHFVERHGLVVLIAIGESVVAVGRRRRRARARCRPSHRDARPGAQRAAVVGLLRRRRRARRGGDERRARPSTAARGWRSRASAGASSPCCWASSCSPPASARRSATRSTASTTAPAVFLGAGASRCSWPARRCFATCFASRRRRSRIVAAARLSGHDPPRPRGRSGGPARGAGRRDRRRIRARGRPAKRLSQAPSSPTSASITSSIPSSAATLTRSSGWWLRSVPLARFDAVKAADLERVGVRPAAAGRRGAACSRTRAAPPRRRARPASRRAGGSP